jgi:hypothetical protein
MEEFQTLAQNGVRLATQRNYNPRTTLWVVAMLVPDPSKAAEAVHRLKQEIDRLAEQQSKALKQAIYVGMPPDEAKEYDQRHTRITQLAQQLGKLEKGQINDTPKERP